MGEDQKAADATGAQPFIRQPMRWFHHDWQPYDAVTIETTPRWKESGLSGDEWRISATVKFWSKGHIVATKTAGTVAAACQYLAWWHDTIWEERVDGEFDRSLYCDQEGCAEKHTTVYRLKARYCRDGHRTEPPTPMYVCFCDKHKRRGDCGLEDNDSNYETVTP